eukprot:TRINITY_DN40294_c0_g1_i1.p1 TRINITY_DN40294_c0_g1~~TRINITY_DN40294_c0_g1_i1.p1  ORF type:complete len:538 (+),score=50.66 TRINITY_DN40294_c0_g1_i1:33-1646(+)
MAPSLDNALSCNALLDWSVSEVEQWMLQTLKKQDVAEAARRAEVTGAVLLELSHVGWCELGVTSYVEQARCSAAVKALMRDLAARGTSRVPSCGGPDDSDATVASGADVEDTALGREQLRRKFRQRLGVVQPGGAEHMRAWYEVVARSKSAAEIKDYFFNFLNTYNIVNLLIFPAGLGFILNSQKPKDTCDVILLTVFLLGTMLSCVGLVASTIVIHTCAAVSTSNMKVWMRHPESLDFLQTINDLSIYSPLPLLMAALFQCWRLLLESYWPSEMDKNELVSTPVLLLPLAATVRGFFALRRLLQLVEPTTGIAFWAGLISEESACTDTWWQIAAANADVEKFLATSVLKHTERSTFLNDTIDIYCKQAYNLRTLVSERTSQAAGAKSSAFGNVRRQKSSVVDRVDGYVALGANPPVERIRHLLYGNNACIHPPSPTQRLLCFALRVFARARAREQAALLSLATRLPNRPIELGTLCSMHLRHADLNRPSLSTSEPSFFLASCLPCKDLGRQVRLGMCLVLRVFFVGTVFRSGARLL